MALSAKSLRKAALPPPLLNPSPASLQSTRLALHVDGNGSCCSVYIASGCRVYKVQAECSVGMGPTRAIAFVKISMEDSTVSTGKESLLIPVQAEVIHSSLVNRCPHRSEIQSVVLAGVDCNSGVILGTVDSYGHLIVSRLDTSDKDVERHTYSVLPRDCGIGEGSWAGMCFSPQHWSTINHMERILEDWNEIAFFQWAAVARALCKSIDVYEQDVHIQCLHTLWNPASLCFLSSSLSGNESSSMLAVAEGCQLTIWDLRTNYNGGCVQRVCGSVGDCLYAVCSSFDGAIGVGGSDRTVTIYDPRRWSALSRWANCSKYEGLHYLCLRPIVKDGITGLSFSSLDQNHIYVQGIDYEVFCGQWKESRKVFSFRGDANWLGFGKCADVDILAGWSECGSIFVADVVKE